MLCMSSSACTRRNLHQYQTGRVCILLVVPQTNAGSSKMQYLLACSAADNELCVFALFGKEALEDHDEETEKDNQRKALWK